MDQNEALRLVRSGGTLVCLDVPTGTELGLDLNCWITADRFRGVKMIPTGVHILYYASADGAPRTARLLHFRSGEVIVATWDAATELLLFDDDVDAGRAEATAAAVRRMELDAHLGAFPLEHTRAWSRLTCHIAGGATAKLQRTLCSAVGNPGSLTAADAPTDFVSGGGSSPAERTAFAMDSSAAVDAALCRRSLQEAAERSSAPRSTLNDDVGESAALPAEWTVLLGELQAAFLLCVLGAQHPALESWKRCADAVSRATDAIADSVNGGVGPQGTTRFTLAARPSGISAALRVLAAQIELLLPPDFMEDALSRNNFLAPALRRVAAAATEGAARAALRGSPPHRSVMDAARELFVAAHARFGWDVPGSDVVVAGPAAAAAATAASGSARTYASEQELRDALIAEAEAEGCDPPIIC